MVGGKIEGVQMMKRISALRRDPSSTTVSFGVVQFNSGQKPKVPSALPRIMLCQATASATCRRADQLGLTLTIEQIKDKGTRIVLALPLPMA